MNDFDARVEALLCNPDTKKTLVYECFFYEKHKNGRFLQRWEAKFFVSHLKCTVYYRDLITCKKTVNIFSCPSTSFSLDGDYSNPFYDALAFYFMGHYDSDFSTCEFSEIPRI